MWNFRLRISGWSLFILIIYLKNSCFVIGWQSSENLSYQLGGSPIITFMSVEWRQSQYDKRFGCVCAMLPWRRDHIDSLTPYWSSRGVKGIFVSHELPIIAVVKCEMIKFCVVKRDLNCRLELWLSIKTLCETRFCLVRFNRLFCLFWVQIRQTNALDVKFHIP